MASRLEILIGRFHDKTLSEVEHAELMELLALKSNEQLADEFFKEVIDRQQDKSFFSEQQSAELLNAVRLKLAAGKPRRHLRYLPLVKWAGAAAAACLCIIVGYRMLQPQQKLTPQVAQREASVIPDLQPGTGNKAVLILADNSRIDLESASSGILGLQGDASITKNGDGQIIYENGKQVASSPEPVYNILEVPNGGEYELVLADGSKVWLNAASRLKFPVKFSGNTRDVELRGEGYFEIAKNKEKPFRVHFNSSQVQVLGTHFNVNAYANESVQAVTLLEGSVKVSRNNDGVLIQPGQQAVLGRNPHIGVKTVAAEDAIAWKNGYFVFDNEDIASIMRKLSRWYDFIPEYSGNVEGERFAAMISKNRNISEVLKMFESTGTIRFKIIPGDASGNGKKVIVIK